MKHTSSDWLFEKKTWIEEIIEDLTDGQDPTSLFMKDIPTSEEIVDHVTAELIEKMVEEIGRAEVYPPDNAWHPKYGQIKKDGVWTREGLQMFKDAGVSLTPASEDRTPSKPSQP